MNDTMKSARLAVAALALALAATAALAQTRQPAAPEPEESDQALPKLSRPTADASKASGRSEKLATAHRLGGDLAPGLAPTGRLVTRIANRVQSRLRNRIDRYYDPQANALSPFVVAGETTRRQAQVPRR